MPTSAKSEAGTPLKVEADGTIVALGKAGETDVITMTFTVDRRAVTAIRLDVLPDPKLPSGGPGRAGNGNFVLERADGEGRRQARDFRESLRELLPAELRRLRRDRR